MWLINRSLFLFLLFSIVNWRRIIKFFCVIIVLFIVFDVISNIISKKAMKKCDRRVVANSFDNVVICLVGSAAMQNFQHAIRDERYVCTRYFAIYNLNFNIFFGKMFRQRKSLNGILFKVTEIF